LTVSRATPRPLEGADKATAAAPGSAARAVASTGAEKSSDGTWVE